MRVLLTENEPGVGGGVSARLAAAGVDVQLCRPRGAADFACEGMPSGHGCPLEQAGTDAALAVRSPRGGPVTEFEAGVACALRAGVPVALIGGTDGATYLPYVSGGTTDSIDPLVAVESAARRGRARLTAPIRDVVLRGLGPAGERIPIEVHVRYSGTRLRAEVEVGAPLDSRSREHLAVRVAGVLRPKAPWATVVDVLIRGTEHLEPAP